MRLWSPCGSSVLRVCKLYDVVTYIHDRLDGASAGFTLIHGMSLQIAQLLTVRRQQEIENGITTKRESRSIERCACAMGFLAHRGSSNESSKPTRACPDGGCAHSSLLRTLHEEYCEIFPWKAIPLESQARFSAALSQAIEAVSEV